MKKLMLGLMMAFAVTAEAEWSKGGTGTETDPWNISDDIFDDVRAWTNGTGRLTITGTGEMGSFATPPWPNMIKEVVVGDGVTSIGNGAFQNCGSLTTVEMPSVTKIGVSAFASCAKLTSITILTEDPPTCGFFAFKNVPATCMMFVSPDADVDKWQSTLSSADYEGGFQTVPVVAIADGKGCYTSIDVNTAISNGCKEVVFCEDCNWGLVVPVGKGTTFDLCGKTLSGALTVNGDLTVEDKSDQRTGKVTGEVSVGADGSFTWKGSQNWTVSSATEIKNAIVANRFGAGIAVTMNGTIEGAVDIPAGQSLTVNGCTFNSPSEPVIPDDMVLVAKEELQAAKAMTVQIVNGQVALGVSVCSNADITASTANWAPVKFTKDTQIGLSEDGTKLILPIPVAAQQGFMILQSGDAKVSEGGHGPVIGEPWYKPTVED